MSWNITLEIDSELKPTELAIRVNMMPGVNDCYISKSSRQDNGHNLPTEDPETATELLKGAIMKKVAESVDTPLKDTDA